MLPWKDEEARRAGPGSRRRCRALTTHQERLGVPVLYVLPNPMIPTHLGNTTKEHRRDGIVKVDVETRKSDCHLATTGCHSKWDC